MKLTIILLTFISAFAMAGGEGVGLFKISGVVIGKTTTSELAQMGAKKTLQNAYTLEGSRFWFNDKNVVYTINKLTDRPQTWPHEWKELGLRPSITYSQAYELIQDLGFLPIENRTQLDGTMITGKRVLTIKLFFYGSRLQKVTLLGVPRP